LERDRPNEIEFREGIENIPDLNEFRDNVDNKVNTLLCFDDMVLEKDQEIISSYFVMGRKSNVSCIYLSQSFCGKNGEAVPIVIRKNCRYVALLKLKEKAKTVLSFFNFNDNIELLINWYYYAISVKYNPFFIDTEKGEFRFGLTNPYNSKEENNLYQTIFPTNILTTNIYVEEIPESIVKLVIDTFRHTYRTGGCVLNPCNFNNMDDIFIKYDISITHDTLNMYHMVVAYPPDLLKYRIIKDCVVNQLPFALLLPINTITSTEWYDIIKLNPNPLVHQIFFPGFNELIWVYGNINHNFGNTVLYSDLEEKLENLNENGEIN